MAIYFIGMQKIINKINNTGLVLRYIAFFTSSAYRLFIHSPLWTSSDYRFLYDFKYFCFD